MNNITKASANLRHMKYPVRQALELGGPDYLAVRFNRLSDSAVCPRAAVRRIKGLSNSPGYPKEAAGRMTNYLILFDFKVLETAQLKGCLNPSAVRTSL